MVFLFGGNFLLENTKYPDNFIRFLGTAGTRFIMLSQRRSSGGIWFSYGPSRGVIDPGPGSLVRICEASPQLSPIDINTLILTHRHIDHSSDLNALAEGMTLKSREPRGFVLLTRDCFEDGDSILLKYLAPRIKKIAFHEDGTTAEPAQGVTIESVEHSHHGVQCYGLIFRCEHLPSWGLISDTAPLEHFPERYRECELLIINVALAYPRYRLDHMSMTDAESMLAYMHPKMTIITHMGSDLLDMGEQAISSRLSSCGARIVAARDGMIINIGDIDNIK
jgi:ribonuclease BN (tRNA processing enzyme)